MTPSAASCNPEVSEVDVRAALKEAIGRMRGTGVPSHTLAAELLLMHTLGCDRAWLYGHPEAPLSAAAAREYFELVARRLAGEPTQYLTGKQEFWGLEFEVNPSVLIPRPETEHVVEVALERLARLGELGRHRVQDRIRIADVGTGSGCLAVALARELPDAEVFAMDVSSAALEVARRNAARHGFANRIFLLKGSLLQPFPADMPGTPGRAGTPRPPFDLVVSNPPYVGRREAHQLPREVREHEPEGALFSGEKGVEFYEPLVRLAEKLLGAGGILVLELGYDASEHVRSLLEVRPNWTGVALTNDLASIPRVISAQRATAGV